MQHLGIFLPLADIVIMKSQLIQITVSFNAACMTQEVGSWLLALARKFGPVAESNLLMLDVVDKDALVWIIALAMQFSQSKRIACQKASLEECITHPRAEIELWKILDTYSHFCDEITILNQQSQGILRLKFSSVPEVRSNLFLPFSFRDNFHRRIHQQHLDTPYAAVVVTSYALSNVSHPFSFSDVSHQPLLIIHLLLASLIKNGLVGT